MTWMDSIRHESQVGLRGCLDEGPKRFGGKLVKLSLPWTGDDDDDDGDDKFPTRRVVNANYWIAGASC